MFAPAFASASASALALAFAFASAFASAGEGGAYAPLAVPVAFHVIYKSDGTGKVEFARLQAQIAQLNRGFLGKESARASSSSLTFSLFSVDYTLSDDWHDNCALFNYQPEIKRALAVDPARYYNVYTCHATTSLGLSWIPSKPLRVFGDRGPAAVPREGSFMLGTILHWDLLPGSRIFNGRWAQGDMLAHEAGHHFGLMHIYEGGCVGTEANSDEIDDTPRQVGNPSGTCAQLRGLDSCPALPGLDDISNYMGIASDSCRDHFTAGQVAYMRNAIETLKPTLQLQLPLGCVSAIDGTDDSPDLLPCLSPPRGTPPSCATNSTPGSTQRGHACCPSPAVSCTAGFPSSAFSAEVKAKAKAAKAKTYASPAATPTSGPTSGPRPFCGWALIGDGGSPCGFPFEVEGRTFSAEAARVGDAPPYGWRKVPGATRDSRWCPYSDAAAYSRRSRAVRSRWGLADFSCT